MAIIPNGVDLPLRDETVPAPWANTLASHRKIVLFLGRIHPKKGIVNLIDAWARLREEDKTLSDEWALVIAGWSQGGHEDELKKLVREKRLDNDVLFVGPVFDDAKRACLQNADAFILPSFSEGLPMAVLEAWAYSLPVLMTPQCNIPEGFAARAAVAIEPQAESIAQGLGSFFAMSAEQRRTMETNGRRLVETQFAWPHIAAQMIDVYRWVLGRGPQPDGVRLN